ncbi:MAG: hypothetical protein JNK02_17015 [Planctomycetes bacterium]|nr:hypothetical protein [Planctomycetota bacterium]
MGVEHRGNLHPLLLESGYWRNRLRELRIARVSLVLIPRPELSTNGIQVDEFRVRAHDGIRIWGLRARSRFGTRSARVRVVGPSDLPRIDSAAVLRGEAEFVFQEPAGRRLEDRVLDVLRVCQLAGEVGASPSEVELVAPATGPAPDEFLIASQLLADEAEARRAEAPLDDGAGWPAAR